VEDSFTRIEFLGNTTIAMMKKSDFENRRIIFRENVASRFYNTYRDLPVLEIYRESGAELTSLIENIVLALRIFKEGDVFCKLVWSDDNLQETYLTSTYEMPNPVFSQTYYFKMEEINQIREIFEKIVKTDFEQRRQLRIACDRLNRSYGKSMYDEKIVDFLIAFEALFVRKSSPNNGLIIATACSMLLGKTDTERNDIFDFLLETYTLRNKIVHGSVVDYSSINEKASKLKEYLRKSIITLL
jgi:hypothetical protein